MKKIYLLIIKSFLGPFVMTFFISVFILLMQFLWKWVDELVGKGLEWNILAELLFYASATFVPVALPLAILLSSLMTFGNLGENNELVAVKAAGISLKKVMMPLVFLSLLTGLCGFLFSNYALPVANLKFRSILFDVRQQKLAFNIKEGIYYSGIDGYVIRVGKKEKDEKTIRNVMIYDHTGKMGNSNLTVADSGRMEMTPDDKFLILTLYNGANFDEKLDRSNVEKMTMRRTSFAEEQRRFDLSAFALTRTNEDLFKNHYQMLNIRQLKKAVDSLRRETDLRKQEFSKSFLANYIYYRSYDDSSARSLPDTARGLKTNFLSNFTEKEKLKIIETAMNVSRNIKVNIGTEKEYLSGRTKLIASHEIEWHRKFTLSFACVILFFIGAPLGAIIRKGGLGLPMVVSVFFFVMYHILSTTGFKYAREGVMTALQGMWLASAIYLPIGILLTIKATSDSPIFDLDSWKKFINRLIFFRKRT
ncbi:MAG: LptF/LptG family permease [Bacteroidetes bacterium]|nr:LptF/LptG family permease [Bacteroidota bacterium]